MSKLNHQDYILSAEGVVKRFGGLVAVDHVDIGLKQGEILGLIGPNGAGKTTLFNMLSGTMPTCMYYTGIDPRTMQEVYVARDPHDKALQRALLQWGRGDKRALVIEALEKTERTDLIGFTPDCLIRPVKGEKYFGLKPEERQQPPKKKKDGRPPKPEGTVHRGRRTDGQKGKMSPTKKAAFAKQRARKK